MILYWTAQLYILTCVMVVGVCTYIKICIADHFRLCPFCIQIISSLGGKEWFLDFWSEQEWTKGGAIYRWCAGLGKALSLRAFVPLNLHFPWTLEEFLVTHPRVV